jgi:hypothetical protein
MKPRRRLWWLIGAVCVVAAAAIFAATRPPNHGEFEFLYRFSPKETTERTDSDTQTLDHYLAFRPDQAAGVLQAMREHFPAKAGWMIADVQPPRVVFFEYGPKSAHYWSYQSYVNWPRQIKWVTPQVEKGGCLVEWADYKPPGWLEKAWTRVKHMFGR